MTPKEKAKELVNKMYGSDINDFESLKNNHPEDFELSKDCALIAVDEMLFLINKLRLYVRYDDEIKFFIEVKQEIDKLC